MEISDTYRYEYGIDTFIPIPRIFRFDILHSTGLLASKEISGNDRVLKETKNGFNLLTFNV